jgi:mechanosensitive ion channel-like protein
MRDMITNELVKALQELGASLLHMLPRLLEMLIIVLLGYVIASLLKFILRSVLRLIKFDRLSENAGAAQLLNKAALPSPTELVSRFVFWVAWLGFTLLGVNVLGIVGLEEHVSRFFLFLPHLFVGLIILFLGILAASFFSRAALLAAVNADFPSPKLLSLTIRVMIVVFSLSMFFEELGMAQKTILVAFTLVFGALMLGLAIAFGLGGQDMARQFLDRRFRHERKEEREDELSPL